MKCQECDFENGAGSRFCEKCGAKLEVNQEYLSKIKEESLSSTDFAKLKIAYKFLYCLGIIFLIFGMWGERQFPKNNFPGFYYGNESVVLGIIFIISGFFMKKRSIIATYVALSIWMFFLLLYFLVLIYTICHPIESVIKEIYWPGFDLIALRVIPLKWILNGVKVVRKSE